MSSTKRLELVHKLPVTAQRKVGLDPILECSESLLFEHGGRGARERLIHVGKRRSTPELERLTQQFGGSLLCAASSCFPCLADLVLESVAVDLAALDIK